MSDPAEPTRTLALTGPDLLRATRAVLADHDKDPGNHIVTPWFGAHAALGALPPGTRDEVVLAAQAIATHYAEQECLRRSAVEGLPQRVADTLSRQARRMRRALRTTLRALERRCGAPAGAIGPHTQNPNGATP